MEAEQYRKNCLGFDVIGIDYEVSFPWIVQDKIQSVYDEVQKEYDRILILANSIGAYFAMHTLQNCDIEKALFISPILDMERLILDMLGWANVSEKDLCEKGEIPTDFGDANLTVLEDGEHWFHTDAQLSFLNQWMANVIG